MCMREQHIDGVFKLVTVKNYASGVKCETSSADMPSSSVLPLSSGLIKTKQILRGVVDVDIFNCEPHSPRSTGAGTVDSQ